MKEAASEETARLQKIFEQHYDGKPFKQGWLMSNVPKVSTMFPSLLLSIHPRRQVPLQSNSNDCGCFTMYFGKKFFQSPDSTLASLKVGFIFISYMRFF
jgi:hypothetical protein